VTVACGSQPHAEPTPIQYRTATKIQIPNIAADGKGPPEHLDAHPVLTPEPTAVHPWPAQLTEADIDAVLELAGWPRELWAEARAVVCGIGNQSGFPWGESNCHPASRNGESLGLFQLWSGWFPYFGEDVSQWDDPVVNARTAWKVYQYDLGRGQAPWTQWSVKP